MNSKEKPKKRKKVSNFFYDFVKITGALSALLWIRHKTVYLGEGKKRKLKGGALIVCNHTGFADPVILTCAFWYRRLRFVALKDIFNSKAKNFFFTHMHCIPIDRENFNMATFHDVCDNLNAGKAVVIFPEGKINETDTMMPFKSGAILMAHKAGVPVVPVCIVRREKWYKRQIVLTGDPVDIRAVCGKVPSLENLKAASELLREKEAELLQKYLNEVKK